MSFYPHVIKYLVAILIAFGQFEKHNCSVTRETGRETLLETMPMKILLN